MADKERKAWKLAVGVLVVLVVGVMAFPVFASQANGFWGQGRMGGYGLGNVNPAADSLVTNGNQNAGWGMRNGLGFGMMGGGFAAGAPVYDANTLAAATGIDKTQIEALLKKAPPHLVVLADAMADLAGKDAATVVDDLRSGKTLAAVAEGYGVDLAKAQTAAQATWKTVIDLMVKAGKITPDQADRFNQNPGWGMMGGNGRGFGMMGGGFVAGTPINDPATLAKATGLTEEQINDLLKKAPPHLVVLADAIADLSGGKADAATVVDALRSGKTAAVVAESYGVNLVKAQTAVQATWKTMIDELVKTGKIAPNQVDRTGTCPGLDGNTAPGFGNGPWGRGGMGGGCGGMMGGWRFQSRATPPASGGF